MEGNSLVLRVPEDPPGGWGYHLLSGGFWEVPLSAVSCVFVCD